MSPLKKVSERKGRRGEHFNWSGAELSLSTKQNAFLGSIPLASKELCTFDHFELNFLEVQAFSMSLSAISSSAPSSLESIRLACYDSAGENRRYARLAAHTWAHLWMYSGHPKFRVGTVCTIADERYESHLKVFLICSASSLERVEVRCFHPGEWGEPETFPTEKVRPILNSPVLECIRRNEPGRLKKLDLAVLSAAVGPRLEVNAFHFAAALGFVDCFSVLLRRLGVDSALLTDPGRILRSDVLECCGARFPFGNRQELMELLLHRFEVTSFHSEDVTIMMETASRFGAAWLISFLLSGFGDAVKLRNSLFMASQEGLADCCRLLIDSGADVNHQREDGATALFAASQDGHADCCRLLIESGADVNHQKESGATALFIASQRGHADCCRLLIESGADVNHQKEGGATALFIASQRGHADCCRLLIESGAGVNETGATALFIASQNGHVDCCRLLIASGADVNRQKEDGWTALSLASQVGHTDCARLLIESGADVNLPKEDGATALFMASQQGHADCCRLLIESGADVNLQKEDGASPLFIASQRGHADCCRLLIESGADVNLQKEGGASPLFIASQRGHADCCRLLIESGADVNRQKEGGATALFMASQEGHTDCARLLIESGADVNLQDGQGRTALMQASKNGHTDCCRLFMEHGADATLNSDAGHTALTYALIYGQEECCRFFEEDAL